MQAIETSNDAWVFPSKGCPLSKDIAGAKCTAGPGGGRIETGNFPVMPRTHSTLRKQLKADPKLVADQLGLLSKLTRMSIYSRLSKPSSGLSQ